MFRSTGIILTSIAAALLVAACAQRQVSFHKDVAPILQRNCATCHSQNGVGYLASGFSVESFAALMKGTKYGPMIDPGSSSQSNLVWLLRHRAHPQINMPKICAQMGLVGDNCARATASARDLKKREINLIATWIDQGARDN
ncbi:MAG: c-type cytochrome domain-containing protein [Steroidobacteraceae bacterium]